VRLLLQEPFAAITAQAAAARAQISYVYAHNILTALERDGFVGRLSAKSGFLPINPVHLLREWITRAESTPLEPMAYYAPDTSIAALRAAEEARRSSGIKGIFTLASAILPSEIHATALPHALYVSGDYDAIVTALRLRRTTPHNFLVLRAAPTDETAAGGVYYASRELPWGRGVAVPQLAVDFARLGGRGREQSAALVEYYASSLLPRPSHG
jgi:hypothetical protein